MNERRTRAEVIAANKTVIGCCDRHADNMSCNCLRLLDEWHRPVKDAHGTRARYTREG